MLDSRRLPALYNDYVVVQGLERTALLQEVRARCAGAPTVLYPGSFIHVAPSFYFQHVVYVDRSDLSRDFFAQEAAVLSLVGSRKAYRQRPYLRYLHADYTRGLPFQGVAFDLLLALYAPGVSSSCARYLRPGGLLLSNDHKGDAREAAELPDLELCAVVEECRGKVRVVEAGLDKYLAAKSGRPRHRNDPRADYFLFRKRAEGDSRLSARSASRR